MKVKLTVKESVRNDTQKELDMELDLLEAVDMPIFDVSIYKVFGVIILTVTSSEATKLRKMPYFSSVDVEGGKKFM